MIIVGTVRPIKIIGNEILLKENLMYSKKIHHRHGCSLYETI